MLLVFGNDDPSTQGDDTGTVVASGQWGLQAYDVSGQPLDSAGTVVTVDANRIPLAATALVHNNT